MKHFEADRFSIKDVLHLSILLSILLLILQELARYQFPTLTRNLIVNQQGNSCQGTEKCPHVSNLEAHHILPESYAKKYGVSEKFYNHPANGLTLCSSCHQNRHKKLDGIANNQHQIYEMIIDLYRGIINDYQQRKREGTLGQLDELYKSGALPNHPTQIYNNAVKELRKLNKKLNGSRSRSPHRSQKNTRRNPSSF